MENKIPIQAIKTLRAEAATAGDLPMVKVCDRALRGDRHALAQVQRVLADARAMTDD